MDMAELARRTGLPVRKLRYVFDHGLVPGLAEASTGHGIPRTFTEFEGFGVALAATLLDGGVTRKLTARCLDAVCRPAPCATVADVPLYRAFAAAAGELTVADARFVRLVSPARPGLTADGDTGWLPLGSDNRTPEGRPVAVLITVALAELAILIQQAKRPTKRVR